MRLILGSKSVGRRKILESMGYVFEVMDSNIDEKSIRHSSPQVLTLKIALAKASALINKITGKAILITADQVVVCNGTTREKPENESEAIEFLESYNLYPAETVSTVVMTSTVTHRQASIIDIAKIYFSEMPKLVINNYVSTGDAYSRAGGFDHEHKLLAPYVREIQGEKESIIGLPKKLTEALLRDFMGKQ